MEKKTSSLCPLKQLSLFLPDVRPGHSKMSDLKQLVMAKLKVGWARVSKLECSDPITQINGVGLMESNSPRRMSLHKPWLLDYMIYRYRSQNNYNAWSWPPVKQLTCYNITILFRSQLFDSNQDPGYSKVLHPTNPAAPHVSRRKACWKRGRKFPRKAGPMTNWILRRRPGALVSQSSLFIYNIICMHI